MSHLYVDFNDFLSRGSPHYVRMWILMVHMEGNFAWETKNFCNWWCNISPSSFQPPCKVVRHQHVCKILNKCNKLGITWSKKKTQPSKVELNLFGLETTLSTTACFREIISISSRTILWKKTTKVCMGINLWRLLLYTFEIEHTLLICYHVSSTKYNLLNCKNLQPQGIFICLYQLNKQIS